MSRIVIGIVVFLSLTSRVLGATINYSTVIGPGGPFENQDVEIVDGDNGPTHVIIQPGVALSSLSIVDNSTATVLGGSILNGAKLSTSASLTVIDGTIGGVDAAGDVEVQILGGIFNAPVVVGVSRYEQPAPRLLISGGRFDLPVVTRGGHLIVAGGNFERVRTEFNGVAEITGGLLRGIESAGESTIHLSGGVIEGFVGLHAFDFSAIHVYGSNLTYDSTHSTLNGILSDGTVMVDYFADGNVILHNVPEPASVTLLGTSALAIILRRKRICAH